MIKGTILVAVGSFLTTVAMAQSTLDLELSNGKHYVVIKDSIKTNSSLSQVTSFTFAKAHTLNFARGNQFAVDKGDEVSLDSNGEVSMIVYNRKIQTPFHWQIKNGPKLLMACGARRPTVKHPMGGPRMVRFHGNGEYQGGCDVVNSVEISNNKDQIKLSNYSQAEFDQHGDLKYASSIASGHVLIEDQKIELLAGTEVYYHHQKQINFFTMKQGQSFTSSTETLGEVEFFQPENPISVSFFKSGHIERGIISEDLLFHHHKISSGSGLIFSDQADLAGTQAPQGRPFLNSAVLSKPLKFTTQGGYLLVTTLPAFTVGGELTGAIVKNAFTFRHPKTNERIEVFENAQVFIFQNQIVAINNQVQPSKVNSLKKLKKDGGQ